MNSKTAFICLVVAITVLVSLSGFAAVQGKSMLEQKGEELVELKLKNEVIDDRRAALERAEQDIEEYSGLEAIAKSIVPQEKDQARTVREIDAISAETGIPLSSIQFPASALGQVKRGAQPAGGNPATSQLTPVQSAPGLFAMEVTITSDRQNPVTYNQLLTFLEKLEQNRRTAHVTNLSIQPERDNRNLVTFTIILNVYLKP